MSVKPLEDVSDGRNLQCISYQIVQGIFRFYAFGHFSLLNIKT